jgi:uncharacterized protein (TIGR02270 family)
MMTADETMSAESAGVIPFVISQHVEDAAFLHAVRSRLARAPQVKIKELATFDARLAAQIDALTIAGDAAWPFCDAALASPSPGAVFTATVQAIEGHQAQRLTRLLALGEASPSIRSGLTSGFGWVDRSWLQGTVLSLLADQEPFRRLIGLTACGMHRVDCGLATGHWIRDSDSAVRARSLRLCGEIGMRGLVPDVTEALKDDDDNCRFWAAWSSVLLGDSGTALRILANAGSKSGIGSERAFSLALQAMKKNDAHNYVRDLASDRSNVLRVIQGSGIIGDPEYVRWLINKMWEPATARRAAESFSLITGIDLALSELRADRPANFESGPADDPEDANVATDTDDGLPWPNPEKIGQWWAANESRFRKGSRCFVGKPVTREHCIDVLKNGYQRQRILAAHYLCLLEPGTRLFNTSAPAWRQKRLLAKLT